MRYLMILVLCVNWCLSAHSEELHNIAPLDTLGDIKAKYPNAVFKLVKAAWVKDDQGFMSMEGPGFPGTLYIAFDDSRAFWRRQFAQIRAKQQPGEVISAELADLERVTSYANDDTALTVDWVRWVPASAIPLERYKSRYGEPSKCDYSTSDMTPFCSWESRRLQVNLTDNKQAVRSAEASFTTDELRAAHLRRNGKIPDWLKTDSEPAASSPTQHRKPAAKPSPTKTKASVGSV